MDSIEEARAYREFCEMRWPETNGEAVCPRCGCGDTYNITTRQKFKCKRCLRQFSATTGTPFSGRKMPFAKIVSAICEATESRGDLCAMDICRNLDIQYRSAHLLARKIRQEFSQGGTEQEKNVND